MSKRQLTCGETKEPNPMKNLETVDQEDNIQKVQMFLLGRIICPKILTFP